MSFRGIVGPACNEDGYGQTVVPRMETVDMGAKSVDLRANVLDQTATATGREVGGSSYGGEVV